MARRTCLGSKGRRILPEKLVIKHKQEQKHTNSRPPVLMIHGMWSTSAAWGQWQQRFEAQGYACHTPTLRHHDVASGDRSPDALGTTSLKDYVDDLVELAGQFDQAPILVGHSMGGLLSQQLATRIKVQALVLVNSAAPAPIFPLRFRTLPGATRPFLIPGFWRRPLSLTRWEARYLIYNASAEDEAERQIDAMVSESGRAATEIILGKLDRRSRAAWIDPSQVTCPMLSLVGIKDRIVPYAVGRALARHYLRGNPERDITYKEYTQHAHWLLGEPGWELVADDALDWITDKTS